MKKFLLILTVMFYLFSNYESFAMIGDSQDNPARSCKEIKHINSGATDGIYWIKSGSMTEAKNYYCDMTTDGGGWQLIFQRRGGSVNKNTESCGNSLNEFLHNSSCNTTALTQTGISYSESYNAGIVENEINNFKAQEYMFVQYDSTMNPDLDDAYIIHSTNSIFPNDFSNSGYNISVQKICDINNENCDNTDVFWRYIGNSWFHSALCNQGFSTSNSYNGDYAYCHNGIGSGVSTYEANSLFGTRSAYNEVKLWKYEGSSQNYAERVYIRSDLPLYDAGFFVTTWKTDNPGTSNDTSITIPTSGGGYNYDIDWTCDGIFDNLAGKGFYNSGLWCLWYIQCLYSWKFSTNLF